MSEHTPGPWTAYEYGGDWFVSFQDDDSGPAISVMSCPNKQEANAKLIAAAPDLLTASKGARAVIEALLTVFGPDGAGLALHAINQLDSAINKAIKM